MPRRRKVSLRLKPEMWISILSLLLSVVTMLLGLYLNSRSENFQKQLLELRNKADLANVTLSFESGILSVHNLGPATAQNLRLVICLSSVGSQWKNSIDDMSDIEVSVVNPAIENSIQIRQGVCQSELTNNDASQVTVKSLPPQQSIEIKINQSVNIPVSSALTTANIYLQTSEMNLVSSTTNSTVLSPLLNSALDKYLAEGEFEIIDFEISMACTNCNLDKRQFTLSSFTKNDINQIEVTRSANDVRAHINISNHYFLPKGVSQGLISDSLF